MPERAPCIKDYEEEARRIRRCGFFARLARKAQIYSPTKSPHPRMRMTHTLDVLDAAQRIADGIPLDIAEALDGTLARDGIEGPGPDRRLQSWLAAAISFGHDLGHPPFGHAGEEALSRVAERNGLEFFQHNWQSLRTVERVEKLPRDWHGRPEDDYRRGMRLSVEVLDGILNHTRRPERTTQVTGTHLRSDFEAEGIILVSTGWPSTLAGLTVAIADEVAQRVSDVVDGLRAGLISFEELKEVVTRSRLELETLADDALTDGDRRGRTSKAEQRNYDYNRRLRLEEELTARYVAAIQHEWSNNPGRTADVVQRGRDAPQLDRNAYNIQMHGLMGDMGEPDHYLADLVKRAVHKSTEVEHANYRHGMVVEQYAERCFASPSLALDWYYGLHQRDIAEGREAEAPLNTVDYVAAMTDDHLLERHRAMVLGLED